MATPTESSPLADILAMFEAEGYTGQMAAREAGFVLCMACHHETDASEMRVDALERLEGPSDPADMLAVVALACPLCDTLGTLVVGYGPEAPPEDDDVLARLGDVDG